MNSRELTNTVAVATAGFFATLAGCTAIADFNQYQDGDMVVADGGSSQTDATTGGTGGSNEGAGGAPGAGGAGGDGGAGPKCDAVTSYTLSTTSNVPIQDACTLAGNQVVIMADGDEMEREPAFDPSVPFPFCFYGEPIDGIWVGDNGYVGFGANPPNALLAQVGNPRPLDESGLPQPGVLPFWDALRAGSAGVCAAVTEQAPYRILWITWKEACFDQGIPCSGASELTFSVGIEETSHKIFMGYSTMAGNPGVLSDRASGQSATIGIVADAPVNCSASACGMDGLCDTDEPCGFTQYSAQAVTTLTTLEFAPN